MKKLLTCILIILSLLLVSCTPSNFAKPGETSSSAPAQEGGSPDEVLLGGATTDESTTDEVTTGQEWVPPVYSENEFIRIWQLFLEDIYMVSDLNLEDLTGSDRTYVRFSYYDSAKDKFCYDVTAPQATSVMEVLIPYGMIPNAERTYDPPTENSIGYEEVTDGKLYIHQEFYSYLNDETIALPENGYLPCFVALPSSYMDPTKNATRTAFLEEYAKIAEYCDLQGIPYLPLEYYTDFLWSGAADCEMNVYYMVIFATPEQILNFQPNFDGFVSINYAFSFIFNSYFYNGVPDYWKFMDGAPNEIIE